MKSGRKLFALALLLIAAACSKNTPPPQFAAVPLPILVAGQPVKLSVAHVVNPRLPQLSDADIARLLAAARASVKAQFAREIEFSAVETIDITRFFSAVPADAMKWRQPYLYDFKSGKGSKPALAHAYRVSVDAQKKNIADWAPFAAREIGLTQVDFDLAAWTTRLTETHLSRLLALAKIPASDGKPAIDASKKNEWLYWDTIGEHPRGFDFVITNQIVASAEYTSADVHSALRGGISLGTTAYSRAATFGAQSWWSTFAFTSNDPAIVAMRGGETYNSDEAAQLAGTLAAHEIGHLLFHFGHPFGVSACVMSPTPMLRFRETAAKLDGTACRETNHEKMRPGAATVTRPVSRP